MAHLWAIADASSAVSTRRREQENKQGLSRLKPHGPAPASFRVPSAKLFEMNLLFAGEL